MKDKEKNGKIIFTIAGMLIILILTGLPIYFQLKNMGETRAELEAEKLAAVKNWDTVLSLNEFKKSLELNKKDVSIYNQLLPASSEKNVLVGFFQELAINTNVEFKNIVFDPEVPKDGYTEIPVKLTFSGSYSCLYALLDGMTKGRRLVCIDDFSMNSDSENPTRINMDISVRSFYLTEKK